jgi:general secretion pathway protein D
MERTDSSLRLAHLVAAAAAAALAAPIAHAAPRPATAPATTAQPAAPADTAASDSDDNEDAAQLAPARGKHGTVTLNFVNADIEAVSRAIGTMLNREMLVDPRVKGTITVYSDKPQPIWQAYRSYLASLRGLGFTVVESAGLLKVVPEADAKLQTSVVSLGAPHQSGDQVLTQVFRLNYENPNNLVAVLRPLITANNTINASPANNSLIITDYADNLQRLGKIIAALDQPTGADIEVIPLRHALASDVVAVAQRLIEGGAPGAPGVQNQTSATSVIAEPRSNSLILRASNPARMASARAIIDKLDRPVEGGGPAGNIWVVYLKNSDATRMAELLRAAIAGAQGGSGASSTSSSSSSSSSNYGSGAAGSFGAPNATSNTSAGGMNTSPNSAGTSTAATTPVSAAARPSTGGQIQADPSTNSLIISAPEPMYRQLRAVIDQLDVRRQQIYVETLIVSVDANKAAEMGIQWQGLMGLNSNNTFIGGGTNFTNPSTETGNIVNLALGGGTAVNNAGGGTTTPGVTAAANFNLPGLNIGLVPKINGIYTLAGLAHFLETNAGGNVLSTPNLISLDNEEAKIVVGSNIGIPTGSYSATTSGTVNPFQTFDRKDVGITLRIRSQIGEGGTVRMTIYQENSSVGAQTIYGPNTDKSSIETNVVVDDGQLMVLGGLIKDQYNEEVDGVPLLSSIPWIGNLFKTTSRTRTKQNMMVFLRPIVIRTQADADRLSVSRYDLIRAEQSEKQPSPSTVLHSINDAPILPPVTPNGQFDKQAPVAPAGDIK